MQNFNNTGDCGLDDCICEEAVATKQSSEKIKPHSLLIITLSAFACAFVFCIVKMNIASASMFSNGQYVAIACGTNASLQKKMLNGFYNDHQSNNNSNKSNCPHQLGSSCLICINSAKRKKSNMHII